jgi:hypothetical protein
MWHNYDIDALRQLPTTTDNKRTNTTTMSTKLNAEEIAEKRWPTDMGGFHGMKKARSSVREGEYNSYAAAILDAALHLAAERGITRTKP